MTADGERCHYCSGDKARPVTGWLVELRPGGTTWARPVCAHHARGGGQGSYGPEVLVPDPDLVRWNTPCGSWRVTRFVEGLEAETRWCERLAGACPYVDTLPSQAVGGRACQVELIAQGRHALRDASAAEATP